MCGAVEILVTKTDAPEVIPKSLELRLLALWHAKKLQLDLPRLGWFLAKSLNISSGVWAPFPLPPEARRKTVFGTESEVCE
jgi:hypothetical protein